MEEKFMQDLIIRFPSEVLDEDGLTYIRREVSTGNKRLDILLKDRRSRHVLVEVQVGALDTNHIDRHIDFSEGYLKNNPHSDIRVMFIANNIDVHKKSFLQRRGYEFKEISQNHLREVAERHGSGIADRATVSDTLIRKRPEVEPIMKNGTLKYEDVDGLDGIIEQFKSTLDYRNFKTILSKKITNEAKAKELLKSHLGVLNSEHLREVFLLVDERYNSAYEKAGPWFGKLININAKNMLNQTSEIINEWFDIILDDNVSASQKVDELCRGTCRIKGASVGLITLFLYLLDKSNHSVWFEVQHKGLEMLYPQIGKFTGRGEQYATFNGRAKQFVAHYAFEHTELDFVLQAIPRTFRS